MDVWISNVHIESIFLRYSTESFKKIIKEILPLLFFPNYNLEIYVCFLYLFWKASVHKKDFMFKFYMLLL